MTRLLAQELRSLQRDWEAASHEHRKHLERPNGSELCTLGHAEDPPDVLITNFTMLSIMLVREYEQEIFSKTREWLNESPDNIFYLVLDELHSYRGTGTEISYTVRQLLEALGLHAEHPQLRIIATSASIEDTQAEVMIPSTWLTFSIPNRKRIFSRSSKARLFRLRVQRRRP